MKIKIKVVYLVLLVFLFSSIFVGCTESKDGDGFISQNEGMFILNGEEFRFAGTNNYYLNYKDNDMIDDVIEDAKEMNLKVIRCWAYLDGMGDSMKNNNAYMQIEPGVFDQIPEGATNGFEALDYAISKAKEEGIYLVLTLTNNWDAFGGVNQYVEWSETAESHDDFYTDDQTKQMYKDYVKYLLNRKNTYTGLKYKDDPTIMAWELMNEPRCESDPSGDALHAWIDEMSTFIKEVDPNHMVAIGDEGFFNHPDDSNWAYNGYSGVDWERNLALENVDYGTFHLYPEHWGSEFSDNSLESGSKWIEAHAKAAKAIGKPAVLEEYGIQKTSSDNRDLIYETWTNVAFENGLNGTMFWILTGIDTGESADEEGLYPDYDGFRVVNDGKRTATILKNHALEMDGQKVEKQPSVYITAPYPEEKISEVYAVKIKTIDYGREVESRTLSIEGISETFEVKGSGSVVLETYNYPIEGDVEFKVEVIYKDGTKVSDSVTAFVSNRATEEVIDKSFTFDSDLQSFVYDASYGCSIGDKGVTHSTDLGDGALMIDAIFPGRADWEELRIAFKDLPNLPEYTRVEYDTYYLLDEVAEGNGVRPYAVVNPGWVKLGVDENNVKFTDLPTEEIEGKTYAVQHMSLKISGAGLSNEFFIGIVGNKQPYEGPVYIDNVKFIKEVYVD